ncbi:GH92 family glycosyl hydrolase [Dyella nitratireducens]|uniref:Alpha-1,2-mannosidase n=1 Tax=Dyella nitratireducens TaxID=1849580 RepID=A0ABQ1GI94_9GAMM|nr:GH92 family glycosyl hydrolase [Dyella nitratireducens]GGA44342.1 alpha-1,2-mannosidase [Dyella nitratireducens]GLQ41756.1 alpha-1,2-mannosidase [Dyella nitratireducens]
MIVTRQHGIALVLMGGLLILATACMAQTTATPADKVNPLIGSSNGGNTYPGAVMPFGMLQWSPENTRGKHVRTASPSGYQYDAKRIRGFSLTHLSGAGCAGAGGDVPMMPVTVPITTSPSADLRDERYAADFRHEDEHATPGSYQVKLANGVDVTLAAAMRSGMASFDFPAHQPANLLIRVSDSEVGSSDASVDVDPQTRTVSGMVTSGNFCGYLAKADQRSYYTLYFVAQFDQAFTANGVWQDANTQDGAVAAKGGTGYDAKGFPTPGKGSGAWVAFDPAKGPVHVRVGISYVSLDNARANVKAEIAPGATVEQVAQRAKDAWNEVLGRIAIDGGSAEQQTVFYTALYHSLLHPNVFSDINGEYRGFDQQIHRVEGKQKSQYANFSGWDVYRSQLQLVTWLLPDVGSDIAQSLYNQAQQNHGEWDRWTHNSGGTHVMSGDPAVPALADIYAFGGHDFDLQGAYASLMHAATMPTAHDLSDDGCNVECVGERPSLDQWLTLHYIATPSHSWGGAAETLEDATADFALSQLAADVHDAANAQRFLVRSCYWRNLYNAKATPQEGYIQNRHADGSWPAFSPASDDGFVEGSAAVYVWMVPFDEQGLFQAMGGTAKASARLDRFFHDEHGHWAVTNAGPLHAELNNEPSVETPWLYDFAGQPYKTQDTVRTVLERYWKNASDGIPGNDDLGEMSSWCVWSALGLYPEIPGRAELLVSSPLFPHAVVHRAGGDVTIDAPGASTSNRFIHAMSVDGKVYAKPWLSPSFVAHGGHLRFELQHAVDRAWGSQSIDAPPSFSAGS